MSNNKKLVIAVFFIIFIGILATNLEVQNREKRQDYLSQIQALQIEIKDLRGQIEKFGDSDRQYSNKIYQREKDIGTLRKNLERIPTN